MYMYISWLYEFIWIVLDSVIAWIGYDDKQNSRRKMKIGRYFYSYWNFLNYVKIYSRLLDYVCVCVYWLIEFVGIVLDTSITMVIAWIGYDDQQKTKKGKWTHKGISIYTQISWSK